MPPTDSDAPRVRRAAPADATAIRSLQEHLDDPAPALLDAALAGALGELLVAVDRDGGGPVGYLLAVDGGPPDLAPRTPPLDDPTTHVAELVVAPAVRRQGHASALLATLLGSRPGVTVTLTVARDNAAARSLYERFGFEIERELPGFFDGRPGLLLARRPRTE
jgi:ribosomal-protein-alanine N-acetyltransferase